jgi:opacity protein-like surface antigen
MKKIVVIAFVLAVSVVTCHAQESRQDVSLSGQALVYPFMASTTDVMVNSNAAYGALLSYRFMITPSSAVEANYGITYENTFHYTISNTNNYNVLNRTQEVSFAYVRYFVWKNFNPFLEAGPAALVYLPIRNIGTTSLDVKQSEQTGVLYGGGIAYELSPSWDFRAEFRNIVTKVPNFSYRQLTTKRWFNIFEPTVGFAYHF